VSLEDLVGAGTEPAGPPPGRPVEPVA
jgi:hypothetical protein